MGAPFDPGGYRENMHCLFGGGRGLVSTLATPRRLTSFLPSFEGIPNLALQEASSTAITL